MFKKSTIILAALCAVTMGMFVGCKHNAEAGGDPVEVPNFAGTYYSFEVSEESALSRAATITTVYSFNSSGELTAVDGTSDDMEYYSGAEELFRSVTLEEDGTVSSLVSGGTDYIETNDINSASYTIVDNGVNVTVTWNSTLTRDADDTGTEVLELRDEGNGVYSLTVTDDNDLDTIWKFKKAE